MTNLEVSANTVAAIAAVEVLFLTFGKFIVGREAFFAVAEEIAIMTLIQFIALCIMLFILVLRRLKCHHKKQSKSSNVPQETLSSGHSKQEGYPVSTTSKSTTLKKTFSNH